MSKNVLKIALFVAVVAIAASAQMPMNLRVGTFGSGSLMMADRDFTISGDQFRSEFLNGGNYGFRGVIDLTDNWALEGSYSYGNNNLRITETAGNTTDVRNFGVRQHGWNANALRYLNGNDSRFRMFVDGGLGLSRFSPSELAQIAAVVDQFVDEPALITAENKVNFNFGGGVEAKASDRIGIRFDLKDHIAGVPRFGVPQTPQGTGGDFYPVDGMTHNISAGIGLMWYLGGK
jgi:opacity protein-like surface antigen